MKASRFLVMSVIVGAALLFTALKIAAQPNGVGTQKVKHVLLLSIDGMHAVDFYNCAHGIEGVNSGNPYCPNLAALGRTGINYVAAISSKPSDSFPGMAALVTGGSPKTTGLYYDVAYDRSLDPPQNTTGTGLAGGSCTPYGVPTGTTTDYDQGVDLDDTKLNGGAPNASPTDGGIASLDPTKLVRDPAKGCAPVYPWDFVRVNTIYGVIHKAGGYTAWIDKHASYSFVGGPGGRNLDDYFAPEVDSGVIALPGVTTSLGVACSPIPDQTSSLGSWTSSFQNIQCYDALKVNALLNEIGGKTHDGKSATVPAMFGMNFQSVYIGESINSPSAGPGGYQNAAALPTTNLLNAIEFVDASVGDLVGALKHAGIYDDTLIIVTAKHGESPIDPSLYVGNANSPATLLGTAIPTSESPLTAGGIGSTEDDVSVLWLAPGQSVTAAVALLEKNAATIQLGQLFYGPTLALNYNLGGLDPGQDPRSPDIIVTPNIGVTYLGSSASVGDHGGFGHDDTNVIMLVSHQCFTPATVSTATTTSQVAPTILKALGLDPSALDAVRKEGTSVLAEVASQLK
jgi:Type I phosphodiesterase / nucleotide pyrophosphatase